MKLSPKALHCLGSGIQAAVMLAYTLPAMPVYADVPAPEWHIVNTKYETNEYIVAGYEAKDFGITADGETDVTQEIQSALNSLYETGGGTLFLPEGMYTVKGTLNIPQGVTLAGDWRNPDETAGKATGTILMAYSGRGCTDINDNNDQDKNSLPFITLEPNSQLRGMNIWYPEQTPDDIVPYPTTIRMYDPTTWGADSTRITDVTLVNSYNAIRQGPYSSGCPNVENAYITPLHTAVDMDGLADVGRFTNIHVSPDYWINSGLDNAKEYEPELCAYMKANASGIKLARIDWSYLTFSEIEGCNHGLEFMLSHSRLSYENDDLNGTMKSWSYPNGQTYKIDISDCNVGLYSEGCSGAGELIADMTITDCATGMQFINGERKNASEEGHLEITDSVFTGSGLAIDYSDAQDKLSIENSRISGDVKITGGSVSMAGCDYTGCGAVTVDKNARQVIISAPKNLNYDDVSNLTDNNVITYNNDEYIAPYVRKLDNEPARVTKPAKADIFVVTDEPYNAPHNEVAFQKINSACTEDASSAIQRALDDAAANGGGLVFCPPGRYTISTPLHVPEGVELRGSIDHARIPMKLGTIFDTPIPENEFLNTDFISLNTKNINGVSNCLSGNTIFNEVPAPQVNDDGTVLRSITVNPYGLRLYSAANAEQAHAFDHSTQLECGSSNSRYIIDAVVSPKSLKSNGEFFITLSRNEETLNSDGSIKNNAKDAFRIANFKANENIIEIPGNVKVPLSYDEMYLFHWELDLTDINRKTIETTVTASKGSRKGEIYKSARTPFPEKYQGNTDKAGHILLQASKVNADKNPVGDSEIYVHGVSVHRADTDSGDPWVQLNSGSGISGIVFNCIGQKYLPAPDPAPYMIQGQGENIYAKNIAFRNVYDGLDFKTYNCDSAYIDGITGIAWHSEIDIANSKNVILANTQLNWGSLMYGTQTKLGSWEDSPADDVKENGVTVYQPRGQVNEAHMEKYMAAQLDCVTIDNCEDILLYNNFSIFGSSSLTMKGNTTGLCVGQAADGSRLGMRVADSAAVDFINTQIVSFYYTDSSHITADPGYNGHCTFLNLSAWSTPAADIRAGGGTIYIYNPTFNGVSRTAFADVNSGAYVYVQSGWINNSGSMSVNTGSGDIYLRDNFFNKEITIPDAPAPSLPPTPIPTVPPDINDSLELNAVTSDDAITLTAEAVIHTSPDNPYTAIIAVYDKSGTLIHIGVREDIPSDENSILFDKITLPAADYYKVLLLRWNSISSMSPAAAPLCAEIKDL